jgi:glycosyltransferase involved in cell wall biosynthesis
MIHESERPVAAQFCATFLKPEMLHIYRQINALKRFRPVVIARKREGETAFPFDPVDIVPRPALRAWIRFRDRIVLGRPIQMTRREAAATVDALNARQAALLHVFFGHVGIFALPVLERRRLPAVVSFHGADTGVDTGRPAHRRAMKRVFDVADLILVRSESLREQIVALGCAREKIGLQRTGIPLDQFPYIERPTPPDGAWLCVQASRLIPKKGLITTLAAFAGFRKRWPKARLIIAGEGAMIGELQQTAADLGMADAVTFPGFVEGAALRDLYGRAHFFLHPSETGPDGDREGVPNALLEAMATGLAVLATRHGGIPEAVEEGVSGYLFEERDHRSIGEALDRLAANPDRLVALGAAASRRVAETFEIAAQARGLEDHYERLIHHSWQKSHS